jgi:hypothetical protein
MTTAADRILMKLDAYECLGLELPHVRTRVPVRRQRAEATDGFEPVVVSNGPEDDFGTVGGQYTIAELQDLVNLWTYRMAQLTKAYADFSPAWVAKDSAAFIDWTNDWNVLQKRYATALDAANSAILMARLNITTPNYLIAAQPQYDGMAKAMRACYPPDGCPVAKGDWDDLFNRLTVAARSLGASPPVDAPPQPTATDADRKAFASTAGIDVAAQATGAQAASTGPLPTGLAKRLQGAGPPGFPSPKTLVWVAVAVVGGILVMSLLPVLLLPGKLAKGVAAAAAV